MLSPEKIVNKMLDGDAFSKWLNVKILKIERGYCKIEMKILENTSIVFSDYINQIRKKIVVKKKDDFYINISSLNKLSPLKIYLFELLRPFGFMKVDDIISSLIGMAARSSVLTSFNVPPKFPIGVRIASIM